MSSPSPNETLAPSPQSRWPEWLPYVLPMAVFLLLTSLEGQVSTKEGQVDAFWYPVAYAVKVLAVSVAAWVCRAAWADLRPWPGLKITAVSVAAGLLVLALWVGLDPYYPRFGFLGGRSAFDPFRIQGAGLWGFLAVRFFGLVALVPLIEELFWRSFLMRFVIEPDFWTVPVGKVTPMAAAITSVAFALAHPEWLPALLTGLLWAWLLWWSRSLSACVLSHATANLGLGLYVLVTGEWSYL